MDAQQENTEATDADLLRKANPFLAKLLLTYLAGDKEAARLAGKCQHPCLLLSLTCRAMCAAVRL